jgi:hypothetical protein
MLDTKRMEDQLARARAFAAERGIAEHLERRLEYLGKLYSSAGDGSDTICELLPFIGGTPGRDFEFVILRRKADDQPRDYRNDRLLNGGIVFHDHENGGKGGWGVHT